MEKVSIIMPCYNDGAWLAETFASIAAIDWPELEVLVVDDGSDDGTTLPALTELATQGRLTLLHQEHQGPAAARNRAFRAATGAYILPLDADDRIDPDYIPRAVEALRHAPQAGLCYCHADFFGEQTGPWALPDYTLARMLTDNVVFVTALIRREAIAQVGGFDESFRTGLEDYDFFLSLLEKGWEIHQLPQTLFHYRIKPVSRSTRLTGDDRGYRAVYQRLYDKHRALYQAHMDTVFPAMREELLTQRAKALEQTQRAMTLENELNRYQSVRFLLRQLGKRLLHR